jgi:hypothetical protein
LWNVTRSTKVLERVAWHVVQQIKLACDFDACECKRAEHKANRQQPKFIERQQCAAGRECNRPNSEDEAPSDQCDEKGNAETPNYRDQPRNHVEQCR